MASLLLFEITLKGFRGFEMNSSKAKVNSFSSSSQQEKKHFCHLILSLEMIEKNHTCVCLGAFEHVCVCVVVCVYEWVCVWGGGETAYTCVAHMEFYSCPDFRQIKHLVNLTVDL